MSIKKVRIGLNGFGRIGRLAARIILDRANLELAAVNSRSDASSHAYLLEYDSTYGKLNKSFKAEEKAFYVNGQKIDVYREAEPGEIPWSKSQVDIVLEASGKYRTQKDLSAHLKGSVKQVILSAPAKDKTKTIVMGVNHLTFDPQKDSVISNSSCTTNCLASIIKPLMENSGIKKVFMTTVHAVTDSQNLLDNSHQKEERLRRSVLSSMIPASTGSAKDIVKLFPQLESRISCKAIRIPLSTVSLIILTAETVKTTNPSMLNGLFKKAAGSTQKGFLDVTEEKLVSVDFKGNPHSAIVDSCLTEVLGNRLINLYAWYDNEWGYANRLVDLAVFSAQKRDML